MAIVVWVGSYVAIFWWACMKYIIRWLYVAFHTVFYSGQAVTTPVSAASSGAAEVAKTAAAAAVGAAGAAAAVGAAGAAAGALSNAVPERVASMGETSISLLYNEDPLHIHIQTLTYLHIRAYPVYPV
jgi:hypothetical protein